MLLLQGKRGEAESGTEPAKQRPISAWPRTTYRPAPASNRSWHRRRQSEYFHEVTGQSDVRGISRKQKPITMLPLLGPGDRPFS